MTNFIEQVQPPLEFIAPKFNPLIYKVVQPLLPGWRKWQTPMTEIHAENLPTLAELYQKFQQGKIRFLIAFRHPSTNDPYAIAELLWHLVPKAAKQQNISLNAPIHAHFIYDRGIPIWAGSQVGWLFSQLGGIPIHRGKLDRQGLKTARELFANGQFPIAAAPEGGTNGHNELISPLEPGIAQMGFWCVDDLLKANRNEPVFILPLGVKYHYLEDNWSAIAQLLTDMEADCGITDSAAPGTPATAPNLYPRLIRVGNQLLYLMENFYRRFYHQPLTTSEQDELPTRLKAILDVALTVAENYFDVRPKGGLIDRCRRLEQAGWDCIYREDIPDVDSLSPIERALADRIAEEASLRMWHMRLVESFVAVTGRYVKENPSFERFAETTLLVWATMTRIKGQKVGKRPYLGKQTVQITVGEPISVSERWDDYKTSRRSAVSNLTADLQTALEGMI
jgi:L-ascorbate metabolism protein UlaG (beta-lactamase superfamily)